MTLCSKCLLHNSFWERIEPGTTQILLTINVNARIQSRNYQCTILNLFTKTGNHTNMICDLSTPLPLGPISLAININRKLATINAKSKGSILNLYIKTGIHTNMICDLSTSLPLGAISLAININRKLA